jgi:hypothetical protein
VTDEAWQQFAERVVQCLERPGFELDEKGQAPGQTGSRILRHADLAEIEAALR